MERSGTRDLVVGLFVLAGIGAVAYLSISIGGFTWHRHGTLNLIARFDETGDMNLRAPVVIAGVRVGEVSKIELDENYRARVELSLEPDLKLTTDTGAAIVTAGMLGDRYIELKPGGEDKMLKSGDEITHTEKAMILEQLLGQLVYGVTKDQSKDNGSNGGTTQGKDPKNK